MYMDGGEFSEVRALKQILKSLRGTKFIVRWASPHSDAWIMWDSG